MDSLPPIPQTVIKRIRTSEFDSYIKTLGEVFDRYHYHRAIGVATAIEGTPLLSNTGGSEQESFSILLDFLIRNGDENERRKLQNGPTRKPRVFSNNAPPLDSVPKLFFSNDFGLNKPHVFSEVCEDADLSKLTSEDAFLTCGLLQDKLALFLDAVEVHLMKEIAKRSSSFFSALHTLQTLNGETQKCVGEIRTLRAKMSQLSQEYIGESLRISRCFLRRQNFVRLYKNISSVNSVQDRCNLVFKSVQEGHLDGALDYMDDAIRHLKTITVTNEITSTDNTPSVIKAAEFLSSKLHGVAQSVCASFQSNLVDLLMHDVRSVVQEMDAMSKISPKLGGTTAATFVTQILQRRFDAKHKGATITGTDGLTDLRKKLLPICRGLLRMDKLADTLQVYKDCLIKELKILTKRYYPSAVYVPDEPGPPAASGSEKKRDQQNILAKQLRSMTFDSYFELLVMVYITILHVMQRAAMIHSVISEILNGEDLSGEQSPLRAFLVSRSDLSAPLDRRTSKRNINEDEDDELGSIETISDPNGLHNTVTQGNNSLDKLSALIQESSDVLLAISDVANNKCSKLISVRSEQNKQLNSNHFYRFYMASIDFINGSESICGRLCFGLKGSLMSQAKSFLVYFHEERSRQLAVLVENDQWSKAEIPSDFQDIVENIIKNASSPEESKKDASNSNEEVHTSLDDGDISSADLSRVKPQGEPDSKAQDQAKSSRFLTVGQQKFFVAGCVLLLLKMITETCQVILGAGATKSAGLKNINAGHIALASQSLGLIVALIPFIKQTVERGLPAKQQILAGDLTRISKAINWDKPEGKDFPADEPASAAMLQLAKETVTLHRVLSKYLDVESLRKIMTNVFRLYNNKFEEELRSVELFTSAGKNRYLAIAPNADSHPHRLLIDIQYLINQLSSLDHVDGPGNHLEVVVNNIKIKDRRRPVQPKK
ncbi:hypothetical protein HDU96_010471 [Phlyctochytrium bullatum]|nr:hypothetical protein HDU96_010471 [Phlyctochytrium bullatum]